MSEKPLPPGWLESYDEEDVPFYYTTDDANNGTYDSMTYYRPTESPKAKVTPPLPPRHLGGKRRRRQTKRKNKVKKSRTRSRKQRGGFRYGKPKTKKGRMSYSATSTSSSRN